jgi:hypothetical protein
MIYKGIYTILLFSKRKRKKEISFFFLSPEKKDQVYKERLILFSVCDELLYLYIST